MLSVALLSLYLTRSLCLSLTHTLLLSHSLSLSSSLPACLHVRHHDQREGKGIGTAPATSAHQKNRIYRQTPLSKRIHMHCIFALHPIAPAGGLGLEWLVTAEGPWPLLNGIILSCCILVPMICLSCGLTSSGTFLHEQCSLFANPNCISTRSIVRCAPQIYLSTVDYLVSGI